jgi:prophage tail gpP-like protein
MSDTTVTTAPVYNPPSLYPNSVIDSAAILAHMVTRPDLVRIDQDGGISEIATLIVGGKIFEDWETVWIRWCWNEPFSQFRFTCAEREPYPLPGQVLQFAPGTLVQIYLGGIQVIDGVIITRQVAYDAEQHMVQLQGVSASWFANRSSIEHATSDFGGKNFLQIADTILAPTGVGYETVGAIDMTPFESGATPGVGETIGQFLESLARDRKIIISNLPNGKFLFIGEHDWPASAELVEGINIKKCQCVISSETAYSDFIVRGSSKASDPKYGRDASEQEARIPGSLFRYSILLTAMEHPVWSLSELSTRALTEKMWNEDVTKIDATITVYGWFRPLPTSMIPGFGLSSIARQQLGPAYGHTLWQAGDEVIVYSPMAMLYNQQLKIKTVTWTQDNSNGSQTLLELTTPQGLNSKWSIPDSRAARTDTAPPTTPPPAPPGDPAAPAVDPNLVPIGPPAPSDPLWPFNPFVF